MSRRILRAVTYLVIFFFTWTMGGMFNVAYAAYNEIQKPASNKKQEQRPEEKFQKAVEDIRSIIQSKITAFETKKSRLKAKKKEIESLDSEIKNQFAATEKKLKNAGLPNEILQRHYNFVKHYEDNLKELRTNLDAADIAKTKAEFDTQKKKIQRHLEKASLKRSHKPLDPNKLPHRRSDIKRKEPRTRPEEFQKDIKQRASLSLRAVSQTAWQSNDARLLRSARNDNNSVIPSTPEKLPRPLREGIEGRGANLKNQQLLLASNGPLTGLVESLPKYEEQQNLPHPLFTLKGTRKKEGSNTSNNPPFTRALQGIKGDQGGFSNNRTEPIILALAHDPPTSADLAETIDVQLTPAIRAKAAELSYSPVKIYNWVRNNVEYVPTYGSIQGADMCLQTLQGNDFDIASLLIALLRASGIHARYVYGTVELPIDKVMNWVGGFTNAQAALDFIASGGTPVAGGISGGKISSVRMEHVWVEAFVKYYPLQGAKHITGQGDSWIPLDASYKQYTYTQGIDIKSAVPFDAQTFVNQIQSTATIDTANSSVTNINSTYIQQQMQNYQTQVQNYLEQNYSNATVGDVLGRKEIIKQEFTYLLGTLPYRNAIIGVKYSEIPDSLRHKITFSILDEFGMETSLSLTKSLPELAFAKISLSYAPATSADQSIIKSYADNEAASYPAYLINLVPELKINGSVLSTGSSITMGGTQSFVMTFSGPNQQKDAITNLITAGDFNVIGLDLSVIPYKAISDSKTRLEEVKSRIETNSSANITKEEVLGETLYLTALNYFTHLDVSNYLNQRNTGIVNARLPSEAIVTFALSINYSFGLPLSASFGGISIDVDRDISIAVSKDGDSSKIKQFMVVKGMIGSAMEHAIMEEIFSTQSDPSYGVSAVKIISNANDSGIPVYTIDQSNVGQIMPFLQLSEEVKTDIQNAVNAGKVVTVPQTDINYHGWTGVGYIVMNPDTGAAGYIISGGLAGGWVILSLLSFGLLGTKGLALLFIGFSLGAPLAAYIGAILLGFAIGLVLSQMLSDVAKKDLKTAMQFFVKNYVLGLLAFIGGGISSAWIIVYICLLVSYFMGIFNMACNIQNRKLHYACNSKYYRKAVKI